MSGHASSVIAARPVVAGRDTSRRQRPDLGARAALTGAHRSAFGPAAVSWQSGRSRRSRVMASVDNEEKLFEPERAKKAREKKQAKVTVKAPVVDKIKAGTVTAEEKVEAQFLSYLSLLFLIILLEGIAVGGSGFLSEEGDKFVLDYIYPAFTPSIGFFLLCSSVYGVWKAGLLGGNQEQPKK